MEFGVYIPASSFTPCIAFNKLVNLSEPQFPPVYNSENPAVPCACSEGGQDSAHPGPGMGLPCTDALQGHMAPAPTLTNGGYAGLRCSFCVLGSGRLLKVHIWIWNHCGHPSLIQSTDIGWAPAMRQRVYLGISVTAMGETHS